MTKLRRLSLIYLWNSFVFLILCGISSFAIYIIYRDMSIVITQFMLCIPFILVFEIKRRSKNVFIFFGINAAILLITFAVSFWFIDNLPYKIFLILYMTIVVVVSIFTRLSSSREEIDTMFLVTGIAINIILSILANYFGCPDVEPVFVACSLLQFIIYIVYIRINRIDYSLEIIESTSVQPIDKILGFNNIITGFYVFIVSAVILVSVFFHAENLIIYTGQGLLRFIRFLAGFSNSEPEPVEFVEMPSLASGSSFDLSSLGEPGKPFFLFVIFEKIFFFVMSVLIIFSIIFGIGYLCYHIYKKFNERLPENGDVKEFLFSEIFAERTGNIFANVRGFFSDRFSADDNNKKVRRIFYKKVSGHMSNGVSITADDTAGDISKKIMEKEDMSFLTDMYRKARYSNELLSDKEVGACKKERR